MVTLFLVISALVFGVVAWLLTLEVIQPKIAPNEFRCLIYLAVLFLMACGGIYTVAATVNGPWTVVMWAGPAIGAYVFSMFVFKLTPEKGAKVK